MKVYAIMIDGKRANPDVYYVDITSARREAYKLCKKAGWSIKALILGGSKKLTYEGEVEYFRRDTTKNIGVYTYFSKAKGRYVHAELNSDGTLGKLTGDSASDLINKFTSREWHKKHGH